MSSFSNYTRLNEKLKKVQVIGSVAELLDWDEQVFLPRESKDQRQDQSAMLSKILHEASADPEIGQLLASLEAEYLNEDQSVVVKESRKQYDRETKLPSEWVDKYTRLCSEAFHAWASARKNDDFASYAPYLQKHLDFAKERADYLDWGDRPYDLMIDLHDPGMDAATIDTLFSELRENLSPLVREIIDSPIKARKEIFSGFPVDAQKDFLEEVTRSLGFNYDRGRIDISLHPFCGGNGADTRMTTRFDEDNPLDSLFSSIHETGHGLYEQGLPIGLMHNALGQNAGMGVHESQSRLWENQVSRSRAFWKFYEPKFRERFSSQLSAVSSEDLYLAINEVRQTPIRVDADEVTYNLHIIIRFEIEKKLFAGELSINDLPELWNSQYKELLGIEPTSNANGVLQDVHWSGGAFGYFPSYCLGNMLAAQLWYAALEQLPSLESDFEQGRFAGLLDWLRSSIHQHGSRYKLLELAQRVTGSPLRSQSLIRYLRERYLPIYGVA